MMKRSVAEMIFFGYQLRTDWPDESRSHGACSRWQSARQNKSRSRESSPRSRSFLLFGGLSARQDALFELQNNQSAGLRLLLQHGIDDLAVDAFEREMERKREIETWGEIVPEIVGRIEEGNERRIEEEAKWKLRLVVCLAMLNRKICKLQAKLN